MTQNVVTSPLPYANNPKAIAAWMKEFHSENPPIFQAGDEVTFIKPNGWSCNFYILDIDGNEVEAFFYDGNPHLIYLNMSDIDALRITSVRTYLDAETLALYRRLVGLDIEGEAA